MVVELRTPGPDKGDAIRAFLAEVPFAGAMPIFVGDDDTDEAGFVMAARLGGAGIRVGEPKVTAAKYHLAGVDETLRWLGTFVKPLLSRT